jgi:hypothetical protein
VRENSDFSAAASNPSAHSTPGAGGTSTRSMPSSSASAQPCSGPAPPNGTRVKSRGSCPRSTDTTRIAPTMLESAIARMTRAASCGATLAVPATRTRNGALRQRRIEAHPAVEQ